MEGKGSCDLDLGLRLRPHDHQDQVAQFTIMYNGEVFVCENVTEAQAKAILLLASKGAAEGKRQRLTLSLDPPPMAPKNCGSATTSAMSMKRSLQRFLEKRKLRMQRSHVSPY